MTEHFLLRKMHLWPTAGGVRPLAHARFDEKAGYWIAEGGSLALVRSKQAGSLAGSKKCDRETGEDLKGE